MKIIENWIDENLTDVRVFDDYPDPTDAQLTQLVEYLLNLYDEFMLEALTCQGDMQDYESLLYAHASRPTIKTSSSLSKYVNRCLKAHAAYLLDKHSDYFAGSIRNHAYQYALEQYQDYMTDMQMVFNKEGMA